jgi:hypothetical protein
MGYLKYASSPGIASFRLRVPHFPVIDLLNPFESCALDFYR